MRKTAIIYARVSTARQAQKELPLESQIEQCRKKAESLGASVLREFIDEGRSGRSDERPAFRAAIDYAERAGVDYLITWSTSRFARNRLDAGLYKAALARQGVSVVYASVDIDRETDGGWITEGLMELMDEYASRQNAADTLRSLIRNAEQGYYNGGQVPYGYKAVPDAEKPRKKRLVIDDHEAAHIREIFHLKIEHGLGAKNIARELNERGWLRRGKRWNTSTVLSALRSETVLGVFVFNRRHRTGEHKPPEDWIRVKSHQAIIEQAAFDTVQRMLNEAADPAANGSPLSTRYFTGILRCGRCDGSMQVESAKGRSRRYYYYNCRQAMRGDVCGFGRIRADTLDDYLLGQITDQIINPGAISDLIDDLAQEHEKLSSGTGRHQAALTKQMNTLEQANERLYSLLERGGADMDGAPEILRRIRQNQLKIDKLHNDLDDLRAKAPAPFDTDQFSADDVAAALHDVIMQGSPKKVRAFFGTFIEQITVYEASMEIKYRPSAVFGSQQTPKKKGWWAVPDLLGTRTLVLPRAESLIL